MTRFAHWTRILTLACCAAVAAVTIGCGQKVSQGPNLSDQERQEAVKKDAEQMLKERKQAPRQPRR